MLEAKYEVNISRVSSEWFLYPIHFLYHSLSVCSLSFLYGFMVSFRELKTRLNISKKFISLDKHSNKFLSL